MPITLKSRKGDTIFDTDEHVRGNTKPEDLAKLRAVFKKDGTVTAGNTSGMKRRRRRSADGWRDRGKRGAKPLGRLVAYGHAGVDYLSWASVPSPQREQL